VTILSCPWCGVVPDVTNLNHFQEDVNQGRKWGSLVCQCGIRGPEVRTGYREAEHWKDRAIEAWNTREEATT
jgi:hypothetical protein